MMTKVSWIQIGLIALGVLLIAVGDRLGVAALLYGGLALVGLGFVVGGGEAIVTRRYVLRRRGSTNATYYGLGAMLYGIIFVWIGVWVISVAGVLFLDIGQAVFGSFIRRPGFVLVNAACVVLASGGIAFTFPAESQSGQGDGWFLNLLATVAHMIPALILLVLGLALLGLGVLEIVSPATFDQMGGEFLELLFRESS